MSERSISERSNPYWPFGPGEKEQWERLLKERPDLAPAVEKETQSKICRTPDGDAPWLELANTYRSERLQALGNGVVPLTAALAFSVLWERMKENE